MKPTPETQQDISPGLRLALDLGPLVVFFFSNARYGIFIATGAFMIAILIALAVSWILARRIGVMPLVTGIVVLVFGGLTLWLQDETFIKLKPTIINALFGFILLGGYYFFRLSLLKHVFDIAFQLTDEGWRILTIRWSVFFLFLAVLNEVVWRNFSTDFWVGFKVWGMFPITLVFSVAQFSVLKKHSLEPWE